MMASPAPGGRLLPGSYIDNYLQVVVDVIGRHGTDAVLRRARLESWIGRPHPAPVSESVDFAEVAAFLGGLEETLGRRGYRGLARRMGSAVFSRVIRPVGAVAAMQDPGFQALPVDRRMKAGMYSLARSIAPLTSSSVSARESEGRVLFRIEPCPDCWGRQADGPICAPTIGMLSSAASWIAPEAETSIEETACLAHGAEACEFLIQWSTAP